MYKVIDASCAPGVQADMHLSDYMARQGLTDADVAQKIGRSRVSVSRYRRGLVRPDWETIEVIKEWSKRAVGADDWLDAAKEEQQCA